MGKERQRRLIREICLITHERDSVGRIHRNKKMYHVFINAQFTLANCVRDFVQCSKLVFLIVFFKFQMFIERYFRPL